MPAEFIHGRHAKYVKCRDAGEFDRHLDVEQVRTRLVRAMQCRFGRQSALARAFVLAVTGSDSVAQAELRACLDLSDYLEHSPEEGLHALARRGTLPRVTVRFEVGLALRGELDGRRFNRLVARIERMLRDPATVPPGLAVDAVVVACDATHDRV